MLTLATNIYTGSAPGHIYQKYGKVTTQPHSTKEIALEHLAHHMTFVNRDLYDSQMEDRCHACIVNASVTESDGQFTATGSVIAYYLSDSD